MPATNYRHVKQDGIGGGISSGKYVGWHIKQIFNGKRATTVIFCYEFQLKPLWMYDSYSEVAT